MAVVGVSSTVLGSLTVNVKETDSNGNTKTLPCAIVKLYKVNVVGSGTSARYVAASPDPVATLVTDSFGTAKVNKLPVGIYSMFISNPSVKPGVYAPTIFPITTSAPNVSRNIIAQGHEIYAPKGPYGCANGYIRIGDMIVCVPMTNPRTIVS